MSDLLRNFDQLVIDQLNESYTKHKEIDQIKGVSIFHEPFTHCVIRDLITNNDFINDLRKELQTKLKYKQKNNDLYKFHQTSDLAKNKSKNISKFREIIYGDFLKLLQKITDVELLPNKIDVTSSKYEFSDYLLCHDDDIHDDNGKGRRFAFIYYLVPDDWDSSDGGNLDLFSCDENLQPIKIVKSLTPKQNSLLFFEVSDKSFHQVSEVLSQNKTRFSINGWFHGNINFRPPRYIEIVPEPKPYIDLDADVFFDWIVEKYINPDNQTEIQLEFEDTSEIKLDKIFNEEKYEKASKALCSNDIIWKHKGPAHRRNYEIADFDTLPEILKELVKVLTCDHMGLTLSNMTGLALHSSVAKQPRSSKESDGENDDEVDDENSDDESDDSIDEKNNGVKEKNNKRKIEEKEGISSKGYSSEASENLYKKFKNAPEVNSKKSGEKSSVNKQNEPPADKKEPIELLSDKKLNEIIKSDTPKCYFEVRRWKEGCYTLVNDDDEQIKTQALDLMVFFHTKSWNLEIGGNVSYIARDEDTELLTVGPDDENNCIALVFRDEETLKFTKYVNSNIRKLNNSACFYEISVVYYE